MIFVDRYIFLLMIFSPLVAAFFITLIPSTDTGSKFTVSRFFASIGMIAFARVIIIFLNQEISTETSLSFSVLNFNVSLTLNLTRYNIFLYGAAALSLFANIFIFEVRDAKTNTHQVAPFLLTFFLYVSFGQADLRVALPLLSIANFIVYFLIGLTENIRRGSTIFHMGIFLFACDALALVLLQIPFAKTLGLNATALLNFLLLAPGLTRLCVPLLAPFINKLLRNVDAREGPFVMVFLELAGLLILIKAKPDFTHMSELFIMIVCGICVISALYVALLALIDSKIKLLPYYFLLFYSSLASSSLFFSTDEGLWFYAISLFLTNITCFFQAAFVSNLINQLRARDSFFKPLAPIWFLTLCLFVGIPGIGIGSALWALLYKFLTLGLLNDGNNSIFWRTFSAAWVFGFVLLACACASSMKQLLLPQEQIRIVDSRILIRRSLLLGPSMVAIISLLIPAIVFYAKMQGI